MDDFVYCLLLARRRVRLFDCKPSQRNEMFQTIRKLRSLREAQRAMDAQRIR